MHATVHHGDALTILPTLPADTVDCVIADPPYNSGGRTATERTAQTTRDKYVSGDATHTLADFTGDNRDQRSYTYWLTLLLGHCLRLARPCASLLVFTDWRQFPATSDALQAGGWTWRGAIAFHKPTARPRRGGFAQSTEYILWATNGPVPATAHPVCLPGLLSGSQPRGRHRQHITQKPLDVIVELVRVCPPEGTVLDPVAGSGTTGVAALGQGRSFVGVELSDHYHRIATERVAAALADASGG